MSIRFTSYIIIFLTFAPFALSGCGATRKGGMALEESGFLTDYSLLSEVDSDIPGHPGPRPKYRYINPAADWPGYDKVLVDPVLFLTSDDKDTSGELQVVLDYFWAELRQELENHGYENVQTVQPSTLRITIALTRAGERNVTMDTFSTWLPFSRAVAELNGLGTGKPAFVGYAKAEFKVVDAETGTLLGAALDNRVGGKTAKGFESWSDVRASIDFWARLLAFDLCLLRGETDCVEPKLK